MTSYYTIIYAVIRHEIDEKISIGLVLSDGKKVKARFSKEKKKLVKKILHKALFENINYTIEAIEKSAYELNSEITSLPFTLSNNLFSKEYLEYLNVYNNDVVGYSKPIQIDLALSDVLLDRLFGKYVDNSMPIGKQIQSKFIFPDYIKERKEQLSIHYNVDSNLLLSSTVIDNLRFPTKVDLAGVNGTFVFAKGINMSRKWHWVRNDLSNYLTIRHTSKKHKMFFVGNEPNKKLTKQHLMWKEACDIFTFVPQNEIEQIEEYAKDNDVVPLNFS